MKINSELGYEPVTYSELTQDDAFWAGCKSCVNYEILMSKESEELYVYSYALRSQRSLRARRDQAVLRGEKRYTGAFAAYQAVEVPATLPEERQGRQQPPKWYSRWPSQIDCCNTFLTCSRHMEARPFDRQAAA